MDAAAEYIFVEFESNADSTQTLIAKENFETFCSQYGVVPQTYISDKGSDFTSKAFKEHLQKFHQTARQALPGAHHASGVVERGIGTLLSISRAMIHHAALHWPDVADVELWPLAVNHACYDFLAAARFTVYQYPAFSSSNQFYLLAQLLHGGAVTNQVRDRLQLLAQLNIFIL